MYLCIYVFYLNCWKLYTFVGVVVVWGGGATVWLYVEHVCRNNDDIQNWKACNLAAILTFAVEWIRIEMEWLNLAELWGFQHVADVIHNCSKWPLYAKGPDLYLTKDSSALSSNIPVPRMVYVWLCRKWWNKQYCRSSTSAGEAVMSG
jgi:hypothetical protein